MRKVLKKIQINYIVLLSAIILSGTLLFAQVQLSKIEIIRNRNNSEFWTNSSVIADQGDNLRLSFLLTVRPEGFYSSVYTSPRWNIILNGDTLQSDNILPLSELFAQKITIRWYLIMPVKLDTAYMNHPGYVSPFAIIPYQETLIKEWSDKTEITLNSLGKFDELFPGTAWFKVELYYGKDFISSANINYRFKVYDTVDFGGLSEAVFRISYKGRTGSKLLDSVLLYRNLPLIKNPVSSTTLWSDHQTTKWIGGNLNSFIITAAMQLGVRLDEYSDKLPLPEYNYYEVTDYYRKGVVLSADYFTVDKGERIVLNDHIFTQGDFIIGKNQIALFYEDKSPPTSVERGRPNELLDRYDLVLGCNENSIRIGTIEDMIGDTLSLIRWNHRW
ncbi:MAG: hypothetical protein JXR87_09885 [Candidatus Marinimicrobia bacterium]|nr:hypothetical protein [Candidatus Neomarinimicrobiota bacterium]